MDSALWLLRFVETSPYEGELAVYKKVLMPDWTPDYFVPHPRDPMVLLAFGKTVACKTSPASVQCTYSVFMSNNFGETWRVAVSYAAGYVGWSPSTSSTDPLEYTILAEDYAEKSGPIIGRPIISKRLVAADLKGALHSSSFHAASSSSSNSSSSLTSAPVIIPPQPTLPALSVRETYVLGTLIYRGLVFVTKPHNLETPSFVDIILYTSHDSGLTFKHAKLPTSSSSNERFYTILDVSGGAIFVNVLFTNTNWGNIYASDENGDNYALNLRYGSRAISGQADFAPVHGIEGIYISNVELTPSQAGAELGSRITYDRGGEWFPLAVPASERPSCTNQDQCFLNLRSQSSSYKANFFSRRKAIGIVMGTGNVGAKLGTGQYATYISRNAGKVWTKAFPNRHTFDISQNGGIILTARDDIVTNSVHFSSDDGLSFNECLLPPFGTKRGIHLNSASSSSYLDEEESNPQMYKDWTVPTFDESLFGPTTISVSHSSSFPSSSVIKRSESSAQAVTVLNINAIPSTDASARFLVTARTLNEQVIIYLDFNATESRTCQGWQTPQLPNSDYETWSPSDLDSDGCILGRKIVYARRKPNADCWVAHTEPPQVLLSVECACSRQDYMCDYCFAPNVTNPSVCEIDCPGYNPNTPPEICKGTWRRSSGYRLVAGDRCVKGLQVLGPILQCDPAAPISPPPPPPPPQQSPPPTPTPQMPTPIQAPPPPPVSPPPVVSPPPPSLPPSLPPSQPPSSPHAIVPSIPIAVPTEKKASRAVLAAIISGMTVVLLTAIAATLFFMSGRNAQVRHSLMRCIPDTWLPAYMPPDREEGPHYHRLQGTSLNAGNEDIFNDDEFLQEDTNVLDLDD